MSKHGAKFPPRLKWECTKNRCHYCIHLSSIKTYISVERGCLFCNEEAYPELGLFMYHYGISECLLDLVPIWEGGGNHLKKDEFTALLTSWQKFANAMK